MFINGVINISVLSIISMIIIAEHVEEVALHHAGEVRVAVVEAVALVHLDEGLGGGCKYMSYS